MLPLPSVILFSISGVRDSSSFSGLPFSCAVVAILTGTSEDFEISRLAGAGHACPAGIRVSHSRSASGEGTLVLYEGEVAIDEEASCCRGVVATDASDAQKVGEEDPELSAWSATSFHRGYELTAWSKEGSSFAPVMAVSSFLSFLSRLLILR
mmetsp:Transcript_32713/g.73519  ORF Transcript_32713/g.73519 Transcript_32713/m.73519 type:complete len:153 (+) Transcript_32713:1105-1563(+)